MKQEVVAIPIYQERVSPLLDVSKRFALYALTNGTVMDRRIVDIDACSEQDMVECLKEMGVSVIIGSAVSGFVARLIVDSGIRLVSWINGPVDDVLDRYMKDCCRRKRKRRGCAGKYSIENKEEK